MKSPTVPATGTVQHQRISYMPEKLTLTRKDSDLLICEGSDVGRKAICKSEINDCYYQKTTHRLRPKSCAVFPDLILLYMRHAKHSGLFSDFTSQTSIAHLPCEKLAKASLLVPSSDEQERLISRFNTSDKNSRSKGSQLAKLRSQKLGLMQDLLTGRVPIKMDDTTDVAAGIVAGSSVNGRDLWRNAQRETLNQSQKKAVEEIGKAVENTTCDGKIH